MTANIDNEYLNTWWNKKLGQNYGVQWKHIAAATLLTNEHFPLVDLGAGSGIFLKLIEVRFPGEKLEGVELSETAIRNKVCMSPIAKGNVLQWLPTDRVVTISLIDVIEHIPDPEPLLSQVAKYADHILIACPNFNFVKARWDVLMGRVPFQNRVGRGGHTYWCQINALTACFEKNGLCVVGFNHLYPRNGNRLLRWVLNWWPSMFAHEFIFLLKTRGS